MKCMCITGRQWQQTTWVTRIQAAQSPAGQADTGQNLAARGVKDLDVDPQSGKKERNQATQTDTEPDRKRPVRGRGRGRRED